MPKIHLARGAPPWDQGIDLLIQGKIQSKPWFRNVSNLKIHFTMVYGRYNELVNDVNGVYKPTNITGGHHPVEYMALWFNPAKASRVREHLLLHRLENAHTAPWLPAAQPAARTCPQSPRQLGVHELSATRPPTTTGCGDTRRKPIGTKGTSYQGDPSVPFQNRRVEFFEL